MINTGPSWWVKLGDLGVSKRVRDDMTQYQTSIRNNFEAPEMIGIPGVGDDEHYTNAVDIWALGYLMYWLLTLELPFPSNKQLFLYCMQEPTPALPRHHLAQRSTSDQAIEFLSKLLRPQPKTRSTARELLAQTWLRSPTRDESFMSDKAFQQYRAASSRKAVKWQRPDLLPWASPVRDDMRVQTEQGEKEAPKEALQQHRTVSSENVIERPRPHSSRRGSSVRDDVHVQTEPDEVEASVEGTTTTTEKRISQMAHIPISHVKGEAARDAPLKKLPYSHGRPNNLSVCMVAQNLRKRDTGIFVGRFPDPFAIIEIDGAQTKKTSVIKKTLNPEWTEVFNMRATKDSILTIEVFDQKYFSKNNKEASLGICKFRVGDILDPELGGNSRLHPSASQDPDADHAITQNLSREIFSKRSIQYTASLRFISPRI